MSKIASPAQGRVPIGYVVVNGQKLDVTLTDEWARYFEALGVRSTTAATQITNIQGAVDMSSVLGTGDGDGAGDPMPGPPGKDGMTGATGPALGLLAADPDMPDMIPGPAGPTGQQGAPGPAIYLTQDPTDTETFFLLR